jgi:3-oxoadipate enol-lactonase
MPVFALSPSQKINYLDINKSGSPVVLLLHGLGATGESWGMQFPDLVAEGFRIIAPDLRGFGKSTYPGGPTSINDMANDVFQLLKDLQIPIADFVGISMGGTVALQFALDYPDFVHKMILINTFSQLRPKNWGARFYFLLRMVLLYTLGMNMQATIVARRIFPEPGQSEFRQRFMNQIAQADPHGYRAAIWALASFDVTQCLGELTVPTQVITGECDTTVPQEVQEQLVQRLPNAQHRIVPGAGHAVIVDQPEIVNKIILDFLFD